MNPIRTSLAAAGILLAAGTPAVAQGTFDRSAIPAPTAAPMFRIPAYSIDTLGNGARLVVVERHGLPIVSVSIHFDAGSNAVGGSQVGASFISAMTREGTTTRSADQLTNDLAMLGGVISVGAGTENAATTVLTLTRNIDKSLDLMMDMMLHSTYPADALERLRTQSLAGYAQAQDNVVSVAGQIAPRLLYGDQPYGKVVTDADLKAVSRDDIAALARKIFVPNAATVYVVGDLTRAQAKATFERAFKGWTGNGSSVAFSYPAAPAPGPTTIYLVDMPNKPQSYLRLAHTMPVGYGPAMAHIDMMDYVLGGGLQSRLSANIREAHGYSYGFNSPAIQWAKGPAPLYASGSVTREKTDSSVIEAMKEMHGMTGSRPVTDAELQAAKNALTLSLPSRLQSNAGISSVVARLVDEKLPREWWSQYIAAVNATTAADIAATAKQYLDPDHLVIVIAGDGAKILASLKAANVAPVVMVDKSGKPVP